MTDTTLRRTATSWAATDRTWLKRRKGTGEGPSIVLDLDLFTLDPASPYVPAGSIVGLKGTGLYGPYVTADTAAYVLWNDAWFPLADGVRVVDAHVHNAGRDDLVVSAAKLPTGQAALAATAQTDGLLANLTVEA